MIPDYQAVRENIAQAIYEMSPETEPCDYIDGLPVSPGGVVSWAKLSALAAEFPSAGYTTYYFEAADKALDAIQDEYEKWAAYQKLHERRAFECEDCKGWPDAPMIVNEVWEKIATPHTLLCMACTERRLVRPVVFSDLMDVPFNRVARVMLERLQDQMDEHLEATSLELDRG